MDTAVTVAVYFLHLKVEADFSELLALVLNIKLTSYTTKMLMTSAIRNSLFIKTSKWLAGDLQDRTTHCDLLNKLNTNSASEHSKGWGLSVYPPLCIHWRLKPLPSRSRGILVCYFTVWYVVRNQVRIRNTQETSNLHKHEAGKSNYSIFFPQVLNELLPLPSRFCARLQLRECPKNHFSQSQLFCL